MKILINERLSEHRCKTPEGYLICTDAILARTGKQTYRKNEIFKDSDDETEIEVDRTEDEVFSPQTLASFENKPVTVEHPDEDVNVHNYKEYAVGFVRDVRRGEANGQPVILGNLVITDEQTIQEIENGEHTDLSCGYDCDIADEANPCQRNIRGNHVALCECGRAGIARIVDSVDDVDKLQRLIAETLSARADAWRNDKQKELRQAKENIANAIGATQNVRRDINEFYTLPKYVRHTAEKEASSELKQYDYLLNIQNKIYEKYSSLMREAESLAKTIEAKYHVKLNLELYRSGGEREAIRILKTIRKQSDSLKDANHLTAKVTNLVNGYAIVPASRWRKFGLNSEVERFTTNLDEARYIRSSLERNDGISFVIVDVTQRRITDSVKDEQSSRLGDKVRFRNRAYVVIKVQKGKSDDVARLTLRPLERFDEKDKPFEGGGESYWDIHIERWQLDDSMKDALIPPTKESINMFESLLRTSNIEIERKGLTTFGRVHYQVSAIMPFDQFVKILHRIDNDMNKLGIPMTFNAGADGDGDVCTAGIDLDKQYVKDSQRAQKIQKIINVVKSIK